MRFEGRKATLMYKLVICDDEGKTTIVPLIRDEISIGRKEGNTIRLTDRNISRQHARLVRRNDAFVIEDIGSLVGTKVNGTLLRAAAAEVSPNDQVTIGDYSMSIRTDVSADVPLGRQLQAAEEAGIGKVTPFARLVMVEGPTPGREVELTADLYVIGRSEEANCRIDDPSISRAHARIDLEGNHWTISDLDSVNGILISGLRKDDYVLKAGDVIEMGGVRLRFVASGEPYDYTPPRDATTASIVESPVRTPWLLYIVGGIGLAAVVAIAVVLNTLPLQSAEHELGASTDSSFGPDESRSIEQLVEEGKDKMQSEEWAAAARLFELALQQQPASSIAVELKKVSLAESDALSASNESMAAAKQQQWTKALEGLERIPRSSRYFDEARLRYVSEQLCSQLHKKARADIEQGVFGVAEESLNVVRSLRFAPDSCLAAQKALLEELRVARGSVVPGSSPAGARSEGGGRATSKDTPSGPPQRGGKAGQGGSSTGFASRNNPYSQGGATGSTEELDPVGEARAAMQRGDTRGAIHILERGGNSRSVLALLASLYMQTGNRKGYETVARKFLELYPSDPKSAQFKRDLRR